MKTKRRKARETAYPIDVRDARLGGRGRLTISSRTTDPLEAGIRKRAVYELLEHGEDGLRVITLLKTRALKIEDVAAKVQQKRIPELLASARIMEEPTVPPILLGATIDRFLTRVKAKLAPRTYEQYEGFCRGMETAFGVARDDEDEVVADVPVLSVTTEAAEGWLHGPKPQRKKGAPDRPWSARRQTVAHAVAVQVWALALAADEERNEREGTPRTLFRNPWTKGQAKIQPPKVRKTRVVFLSRSQAGRLLWATRNGPSGALMALGLYAGLRAGEIQHLRLGTDVRLDRGEVAIQPREGRHPWRPKTDNSLREVPMTRQLARWIRHHARNGWAGETYLIHPQGEDKPISDKTRERWVVEAFQRAGIDYGRDRGDGSTLHTLRHTFASWLVQQDVQLMKVARLMGDRTAEVEKTYAHLLPTDLRGAVALLTKKRFAGDLSGELRIR